MGNRGAIGLALLIGLIAVVVACSGSDSGPTGTPTVPVGTFPPSGSPTPVITLDPALHDKIPVDHVVVLMQENHSFDNYFGQLKKYAPSLDVEAQPDDASNPDPKGGAPIAAYHETSLCASSDLNHSWDGTHSEIDGGAMDGFTAANVAPNDPSGKRAMGYYNETDLPFYYGLFSTFAIGDRYFASVPGPTQPNRFYLYSGTSFGRTVNGLPPSGDEFSQRTIFNELDESGVSWKIYSSQFAYSSFFAYVRTNSAAHVSTLADYYADAAAGKLPNVAFVDPVFIGEEENDEHPPADAQIGQKFVSDVIAGLMASPNWASSAMFLEWDEHGGYYDHVAPPAAVPPDDIAPMGATEPGQKFDSLGVRVPFALISPFAKKSYVSHTTYDHTSVLAFIEERFGLDALTARDGAADPMLEMFDFADAPFVTPPTLPEAVIEEARRC
ncbi:MAG: alkaline phosphatase family protein [Chloroflexota bacterium]